MKRWLLKVRTACLHRLYLLQGMPKRNVGQLLMMYGCLLFYIVFLTPNRYEGNTFHANLIPFLQTLERIHKPEGEHFWKYYIEYWGNFFGNIIIFLPFGYLVSALFVWVRPRRILLYGLATSVCIEFTQMLLKIGVFDVDDILLNVTGACTGIFIFQKVRKRYMIL